MDLSIIGWIPDVVARIEALTQVVQASIGLAGAVTALIFKIGLLISAVAGVVLAWRKLMGLFAEKSRKSAKASRKRSTSGSSRTRN